MIEKRKPGPARLPDSAVTDAALRARRSRERRALERRGSAAVAAGGPATCATCSQQIATTDAEVYFDVADRCAVSILRLGGLLNPGEESEAIRRGHSLEALAAAEAAPVEAA